MKTFSNFFGLSIESLPLDNASKDVVNNIISNYFPQNETDFDKMSALTYNKGQVVEYIVSSLDSNISFDDANQLLIALDSYNRPSVLYKLSDLLNSDDWLKIFRSWWTQCDSCSLYYEEFKSVFSKYDVETIRKIIHDESDTEFYNSLPDVIDVYRGTFIDERFKHGISWTTDEAVATRFKDSYEDFKNSGAMRLRYMINLPKEIFEEMIDISKQGTDVLSRKVDKSDIFVITSRGEKEVIVLN